MYKNIYIILPLLLIIIINLYLVNFYYNEKETIKKLYRVGTIKLMEEILN